MFYTFNQNNSGGGFDMDDDVAHFVIIEAESADEANDRAEEIGIYFDDDYEVDCPCCGTRWSRAWEGNGGDAEPLIYDKAPEDYQCMWTPEGRAYAHVYYKDGTKRSFTRNEA